MDEGTAMPRATIALVANGSQALIVRVEGGMAAVLVRLGHDRGRAHGRDVETERPGRYQSGIVHAAGDTHGMGAARTPRSGLAPHTTLKEADHEAWGRELAREFHTIARAHPHDALAIVATPQLLGRVRAHLDEVTLRRVRGALHHDYTHARLEAIVHALAEAGLPGVELPAAVD